MKITDFVLVSKTMKKFTVSFTIHKSMTKILSSAVETGWQVLRYFLYLLLVPLVPCQLGFTRVCNSDQTTLSSTAICPAGIRQLSEAETECSCLQRTQVEDNLINGINPLGRDSKQCYQVSSDMTYLYKNGMKPNIELE